MRAWPIIFTRTRQRRGGEERALGAKVPVDIVEERVERAGGQRDIQGRGKALVRDVKLLEPATMHD